MAGVVHLGAPGADPLDAGVAVGLRVLVVESATTRIRCATGAVPRGTSVKTAASGLLGSPRLRAPLRAAVRTWRKAAGQALPLTQVQAQVQSKTLRAPFLMRCMRPRAAHSTTTHGSLTLAAPHTFGPPVRTCMMWSGCPLAAAQLLLEAGPSLQ